MTRIKCQELPYVFLRKEVDKNKKIGIVICALTDEQEEALDRKADINIKIESKKYGTCKMHVSASNVFVYGEVDFSTDSPDYKYVAKYNLIDDNVMGGGFYIPLDYDYETHTGSSHSQTSWNVSKAVQYAHGCIGKPKKIVIFRYVPPKKH